MNNTDWADYQRHQEKVHYADKEDRERREDDETNQAAPAKACGDGAGATGFGMVSGIAALGFAGLLIASIAQVFGPFFGTSTGGPPVFKHSMASFLILAVALHLVLRISRRNRLSMWLSVPLLFFYGVAQVGVLDGLRGGTEQSDLLRLAIVCAIAMGLWLVVCSLYRFIAAHIRDEALRKKRDAHLVAANNAVLDDAKEGKEGEQRVHDALELAVRRQFGADAVVIPRGGLLPIEGRIPFTDIDHIVVTPHCVIAVETKDWKWQRISPVPGDESFVERRRPGRVERFENPYGQASRKPDHLRRAVGLGSDVPIEFAVCFAGNETELAPGFPGCMTTIGTLPSWLQAVTRRHQETRLDASLIAGQIASRLDYGPSSYERFRVALESGGAYAKLLADREEARAAMLIPRSTPKHLSDFRPGLLPLGMFGVSVALLCLTLVMTQTGALGSALADALESPAKAALGWLPPGPSSAFLKRAAINAPRTAR